MIYSHSIRTRSSKESWERHKLILRFLFILDKGVEQDMQDLIDRLQECEEKIQHLMVRL